MNLTELLKDEIEMAYRSADGLMALVDDAMLDWKPESGDNWMTAGQLLMHLTTACGFCMRGMATGDWSLPDGQNVEEMSEDEMLPPAEKLPAVESVEQARAMLAEDKRVAIETVVNAGEDDLANRHTAAPWAPDENYALGRHLIQMVGHLSLHKAQLFYYLKLLGKPVNTGHLWGM